LYLSRLEIFGFKSFANKTVLNFTKGITGIVGPNGCGKTNIVDALRWSLGEQKSATLRSDKMENVIFNGTREKKPMGMSEVSLTLVNDDGVLPSDYTEVTITRRIFRSGESEYLLNKNLCRLKDITNLFMDTGMGTNAYSVIELKMIEVILSSKAEERRKMFEEAAGVNKYKLRRRLSLKKLDEVKADLTRVNDIVSEVEKTVRSLERQAKRADQYNQIHTVLREKELDLAGREFSHFTDTKNKYLAETQESSERREKIDVEIKEIENELIQLRSQINEVETELKDKRYEISRNNSTRYELQNKISVGEERINSLNKNQERFKQEIDEFNNTIIETEELLESTNDSIVELKIGIEKKETNLAELAEVIRLKTAELEEKRKTLKTYNDDILTRFKDLAGKENQFGNIKKALASANESIESLNARIQSITNNIAKTVGYLEELANEKQAAEKKLYESEKLYAARQKEKEDLEKELSELKDKELDQKGQLTTLRDKIEFLQTLISNLEGISRGAKILIESRGWTDKEKNLFADVGNTEEKFRFALEAALKVVLNNLLIENFDDLQNAISYLTKNDLGKASFYLLQQPNSGKRGLTQFVFDYNFKRKAKKLAKEPAFLGWASELVQTDEKWKPYFDKVLLRSAVTENLESALQLNQKYPEFNFTTLNGDLVESSGIIEAGSSPKLDETLFGRKQLIENLKNDYPRLEVILESTRKEIAKVEDKISQIDLKNISEQGKILLNDITNIEKQISQFEFEKKKAGEEIDNAQSEIQKLAVKANDLDNEITRLNDEIEKQTAEKQQSEEILKNYEAELAAFEEEFSKTNGEFNQKKIELERFRGQLQNAENELSRAESTKVSLQNSVQKKEKDIASAIEESNSMAEQLIDYKNSLEDVNEVLTELRKVEREIDQRLEVFKQSAAKSENQLKTLRNDRQTISDSIHTIDLKINEINLRLENLTEHIKESYTLELAYQEYTDLDTYNFKEQSQEVFQLKEKLKNLGPINLLAYSEYEQEKERLDFLWKQRDDLVESEKELVKTINEINETAQRLFSETFELIRQNFIRIFQTLFDPGDEADLVLEEGVDPLEAKIEITAKPKGKRPTGIELLSGGEKTLTATALLFAIYLVKPSPFCILDEVDAPLDDANVDRFTKLLKEFSKNTQFIIVTHNKRTMEASETMYGVTMQEEGISKLVSVQFNEDIKV
jgi:chromosome segregation protein